MCPSPCGKNSACASRSTNSAGAPRSTPASTSPAAIVSAARRCRSLYSTPGPADAIASRCAVSTTLYSSRCAPVNARPAGNVRVTSDAYPCTSGPASISTSCPSRSSSAPGSPCSTAERGPHATIEWYAVRSPPRRKNCASISICKPRSVIPGRAVAQACRWPSTAASTAACKCSSSSPSFARRVPDSARDSRSDSASSISSSSVCQPSAPYAPGRSKMSGLPSSEIPRPRRASSQPCSDGASRTSASPVASACSATEGGGDIQTRSSTDIAGVNSVHPLSGSKPSDAPASAAAVR